MSNSTLNFFTNSLISASVPGSCEKKKQTKKITVEGFLTLKERPYFVSLLTQDVGMCKKNEHASS